MYLPGECYIDVFMALLGVFFFNIMDAHINALNRPKPPGRKGSSERGSLPDYPE